MGTPRTRRGEWEGQMEDAWQSRDWETVRRLQDEERQWETTADADVGHHPSSRAPFYEDTHRDRDGR